MEPITWGALSAAILFVIAVAGFSIKIVSNIKTSMQDDIKDRLAIRAAESRGARELLDSQLRSKASVIQVNLDALTARVNIVEGNYASKENLKELREGIDGVRTRLDDLYTLLTRKDA